MMKFDVCVSALVFHHDRTSYLLCGRLKPCRRNGEMMKFDVCVSARLSS